MADEDIHIHIHLGNSDEVEEKLDTILAAVIRGDIAIMADTAQLEAAVAANTDVVQSAVTALEGLADVVENALREQGATQEAIDAATSAINESAQSLANAIPQNTPADPANPDAHPDQTLPGDLPHPEQRGRGNKR